jgi:peroxiredoxin Q/BCP
VEAGEFRSAIKQFQNKAVIVLGISPDTPKTLAGFKEKQNLPFTLLSDAEKKIAETYGVLKEKNMYGKMVLGIERTTFLIGPDGNIQHVFRKVKPEGHAKEVLAAIPARSTA